MKNDVTYVVILVAFFVLSVLFVFGCDKIIGPDDIALDQPATGEPEPEPRPEDERQAA